MSNPLVTIVTATTANKMFEKCTRSVDEQTYKNIQHLVFVDGQDANSKLTYLDFEMYNRDIVNLPYAVGTEQYNGHRMYAAGTYLGRGEYFMFLDEDNWLEPTHVEEMVAVVEGKHWAYTLRKICDMDGNFVCFDDCESLGDTMSVLGDNFVDVNCYVFSRRLALDLSPFWFRRARHPEDQPEVDRVFSHVLFGQKVPYGKTGSYTVNYRAGNRADSVQAQFFLNGNEKMYARYLGNLPWRKVIT